MVGVAPSFSISHPKTDFEKIRTTLARNRKSVLDKLSIYKCYLDFGTSGARSPMNTHMAQVHNIHRMLLEIKNGSPTILGRYSSSSVEEHSSVCQKYHGWPKSAICSYPLPCTERASLVHYTGIRYTVYAMCRKRTCCGRWLQDTTLLHVLHCRCKISNETLWC